MTTNLIPMAGIGSRFNDVGYILPKPLIPVSGVPMIIKAIRSMPKADKWIFVVRQEHINDYSIDKLIKNEIPDAIVIPVSENTEGQACTCKLAEKHFDKDDSLFIAACDNASIYREEEYNRLCNNKDVDSIVWTFTKSKRLEDRPTSWGWCKLEDDNSTIKDMSIKVPVSEKPYDDHAVVASFFFKKTKDFIDAVNLMIKEDYRIKNEFYVDAVPIFMKKLGKKSVIFDVEHIIMLGSPEELYEYQRWEYFCKNNFKPGNLTEEDQRLLPLWKEYFNKNI